MMDLMNLEEVRPGLPGRGAEPHGARDDTAAGHRLTEHPAEEAFRLDHIDLPVQRKDGAVPSTRHGAILPPAVSPGGYGPQVAGTESPAGQA